MTAVSFPGVESVTGPPMLEMSAALQAPVTSGIAKAVIWVRETEVEVRVRAVGGSTVRSCSAWAGLSTACRGIEA
jgi:alcohol dehydrogenase YqhD (iron-dependent ADH family)